MARFSMSGDGRGPYHPRCGGHWRSATRAAVFRTTRLTASGARGLRFTDAHHIVHWADGGETALSNLILLCGHHHRALHEEGFRVRVREGGAFQFFDRTGWPLPNHAPLVSGASTPPRRRSAVGNGSAVGSGSGVGLTPR